MVCFKRMTKAAMGIHGVDVAAPVFGLDQVPVLGEISEDRLHGALGDADTRGEFACGKGFFARQAKENVSMVGQKCPAAVSSGRCFRGHRPLITRLHGHAGMLTLGSADQALTSRSASRLRLACKLQRIEPVRVMTMTPNVSGIGSLPTGVSERISLIPAKASSSARP